MAPELRSKRAKRRAETKEDIKHLLGEVWDYDLDRTFYKIFSRDSREGIKDVINMTNEDLKELTWREDNGDVCELETSESCKILSLKNYNNWDFTSYPRDLQHNNITLDDWEEFMRDPSSKICLESTGDITSDPPPGFAGSSGSYSHQLTPVESFKRSIKLDSSQFSNFKEVKHWDTWRRNTLETSIDQDVEKVLDPDYTPLTQKWMNMFSEK